MNYKISRYIKRLAVSCIGLAIFSSILFFVFIAPHRTPPILMYHLITKGEQKDNILALSEDIFRRQMQYLSRHNYNIVSLKEFGRMIQEGIDIPADCVVLTFDDGYRNFYNQAYPILKKHKFNAAVFVTIDFLEKTKNSLSWEQIEQLAKDDLIDIGSHTLSHKILPLLTLEEARKEIFISKLSIEERLKKPVVVFSYPCGAVDDSIKEMVKEAGFKVAVGTAYQRGEFKNNDPYILKRVFVSKISKYPFAFKFMVSGYYVPTRELVLRILNIKVPRALYTDKEYRHRRF